MNKLLAVLISSAMLVSAGQVLAQGSTPSEPSGSTMSKDQSVTNGNGMKKKHKKQKKTHKKVKSSAMAKEPASPAPEGTKPEPASK